MYKRKIIKLISLLTISLAMLFSSSILLFAGDVLSTPDDAAMRAFIRDLNEMTFDTIEEEADAIRELTKRHFGTFDEWFETQAENYSIDRTFDLNSAQASSIWVDDYLVTWQNNNVNFNVPSSVFYSRFTNGILFEGQLRFRGQQTHKLWDDQWMHYGWYQGWIHPSGNIINRDYDQTK